jgi:predicted acetyltransferase
VAGLIDPTTGVHRSFVAAMEEFAAEGRGHPADGTALGAEIRQHGRQWSDVVVFARYVQWLLDLRTEEAARVVGWVPCTTLWWVEGEEFYGRIALRHRLTPQLTAAGGHIGYDVRPTARGRGHATAMLGAVLPLAAAMGIEQALLTCDEDNLPSRKVILAYGGVPVDMLVPGTQRFWVPTATAAFTGNRQRLDAAERTWRRRDTD